MPVKCSFSERSVLVFVALFIIPFKQVIGQSLPPNQLILPSVAFSISFQWQGDSIHSTWEPHAAMLVPVQLKNCPRRFYMQFDLGAPYSLFYKNKLVAIKTKYPASVAALHPVDSLKNFSFNLDGVTISAKEIISKQFDSSAIDWSNEDGVEIIGTIGSDLVDGNIAIIDYPNKKISISATLPERITENSLTDFIYTNRAVLLPAEINDKETLLYFDTGSSMFELLTSEETSRQLASPGATLIQYEVQSWNQVLTATTIASNKNIRLANMLIPIHSSTYMQGVNNNQLNHMAKMGIGGMTGNKIFLHHILILDTKNKKFGIIQQEE